MQRVFVSACLVGKKVRYDGNDLSVGSIILKGWINEGRVVSFCPEVAVGLPTPRPAAEIVGGNGDSVLSGKAYVMEVSGRDASQEFIEGAQLALSLCLEHSIFVAILAESSPSCGSKTIYNGEFSSTKIMGAGVTASLLREKGISVYSQHEIPEAAQYLRYLSGSS
jgi:uncharacterized protein YbbK (DUF523 family)